MSFKRSFIIMLFACIAFAAAFAQGASDALDRAKFSIAFKEKKTTDYTVVSVKDFGAAGDGVRDDTSAVQRAVDRAGPGSEIRFPKGTYLITSPVVVRQSDILLNGDGAKIVFRPSSGKEYKVYAVKNGKSTGYKLEPAAIMVVGELEGLRGWDAREIVAGDEDVFLKSPANGLLKKNDIIVITAKDSGKKISRRKEVLSFYREQNFVTSIEDLKSGTIRVSDPVSIPFAADSAPKLYRMKPVRNVTVREFQIEIGGGSGKPGGVLLAFAADSSVEKVSTRNTAKFGIGIVSCYRCEVSDSTAVDSVNFGSAEGFGIMLERSHFCAVKNNKLNNHRHGIILDHGNGNNLIEGNLVENAKTSGSIDLHGEYNYFNTVRDNTVSRGKTGIVVGGGGDVHYNDGPENAVVGNSIDHCDVGIEINNESMPVIVGKNRFADIKKNEIQWNNVDKNEMIDLK